MTYIKFKGHKMSVEKRDAITSFALTISEKKELVRVSDKVNKRISDYIRDCILTQMKKDK
jgi:hypothetical protein